VAAQASNDFIANVIGNIIIMREPWIGAKLNEEESTMVNNEVKELQQNQPLLSSHIIQPTHLNLHTTEVYKAELSTDWSRIRPGLISCSESGPDLTTKFYKICRPGPVDLENITLKYFALPS